MKKIYIVSKTTQYDVCEPDRRCEEILISFESKDSAISYANEYIQKEIEYAVGTWEFFGSWEDERPMIFPFNSGMLDSDRMHTRYLITYDREGYSISITEVDLLGD